MDRQHVPLEVVGGEEVRGQGASLQVLQGPRHQLQQLRLPRVIPRVMRTETRHELHGR